MTWAGIDLGGIIIEIVGERAVAHHGGYRDPRDPTRTILEPIEVSWRTEGPNLIFNLRGWRCRIMQVQEGHRHVDMLDHPYCTADGIFTVDWANPASHNRPPHDVTVFHA